MSWLSRETAEKSFFGRDFMRVCDSVDIRHIPRVQAESPDSRFQYRFQHLSELHSIERQLEMRLPVPNISLQIPWSDMTGTASP
jgi:hypothetical protein